MWPTFGSVCLANVKKRIVMLLTTSFLKKKIVFAVVAHIQIYTMQLFDSQPIFDVGPVTTFRDRGISSVSSFVQ